MRGGIREKNGKMSVETALISQLLDNSLTFETPKAIQPEVEVVRLKETVLSSLTTHETAMETP